MIPSKRSDSISPWNSGVESSISTIKREHVSSEVAAQKEFVFFTEAVVHLRVEVVEVISRAGYLSFFNQWARKYIYVCASTADYKARLVFHNRAFNSKPGTDKADAAINLCFLSISFAKADIEYGANASTVTSRHGTFMHIHVLDGVSIEHAEESK